MLDTTRNDAEFTGLQSHAAVAELDSHPTAPDKEELILPFVMVPGKDSGQLHQFHFLAVQLRNDLRSPVLVNQRKLLFQGAFVHAVRVVWSTNQNSAAGAGSARSR